MKQLIIKILNKIATFILTLANRLSNANNTIKLIKTEYNANGRFQTYILSNTNLESHKDILENIYLLLMNNNRFLKFGKYKVIIISVLINGVAERLSSVSIIIF
uniref:hypothetical protein n=1 Tax=Infundibulicybe hongyinpan TaxID=2486348 RepID=UPI00315D7ACE